MRILKLILFIIALFMSYVQVSAYVHSTVSWSSSSGWQSCPSGTTIAYGSTSSAASSGTASCIAYCGTDLYYSSGACRAVGNGYYSPNSNDGRYGCRNAPGDNNSRNYYYTSDGNGGNNCSYTYSAKCGTDLYESSNGTCSAVGTGYYSPSSNNSRYSCSNAPGDNNSRNYYYTGDGNGSNSCSYTYSAKCGTDLYESSNGACSAVGTGYYSPSSNNSRYSCSNAPGDNNSRNYYYTGDGNGSNSCSYTYSAKCGTDLYESSNGACSAVGTGYYSPSSNNSRYSCSNAPGDNNSRNYYYTGDGNGSNSCSYTYSAKCGTDLYESSNGACSAVGTGYYSPSSNNARYSCSNAPGDNNSRNYYYTSDGNGGNSCSYTYSAKCGVDLYETSNGTCSAVGISYYSTAGNNARYSCTNIPSDNTSRNYYYTSDGNGGNSCSYTYAAKCGTDLYESSNGSCSAVGTGYYSPSSNNTRYSCTNIPSDNTSRNYYYTGDGNGVNGCSYSYSAKCGTDLYESSNGSCSAVGTGYYSPSSNNTRYSCTNIPSDNTSRNYYYTSDGNGGNSCSYTYAAKCGVDLYETSNGTCSAVGTGYYSPSSNNTRSTCTNKPSNSTYSGDGNGSNNCTWTCNSGYAASGGTCVDVGIPTGNVQSYSPSGWTNGNVTVTVTCSDGGSGCSAPTFSKVVSSNGTGTVEITDNTGNSGYVSYNVTNIDKTKPTGSVSHNSGWYNSSQTITFSASDTGGSKLKRMRLQESVNGGTYTYISGTDYDNLNTTSTVTRTYTRSAVNGNNYQYRLVAWDYTGHYSIIYPTASPLYFDTIVPNTPTITSSTHSSQVWSNVDDASFSITKNNAGPSASTNYYCIDTTNSCNPTTAGNSKTYTNISTQRQYFRAKTCDTAGCSGIRSFTLNVDTTGPNGSVSYSPSAWTNTDVTITVTCSDSGSGCDSATTSKTVSANSAGTITISDYVGNTSNISYNVTNIDKIKPTGNVSHNTGWQKNAQTITFSASDTGGSKLKRIWLQESVNGGAYAYVSGTDYNNLNTTSTVTRTFTRSAVNDNSYRYRLVAWDYTGHYSIIYGPSSPVYFDTVAPSLPTISSSTHTHNVWSNNSTASFAITKNNAGPSPSTNYYCIDTANSCNPSTAGDSKTYSGLSTAVRYFRAKTCDTAGCSGVRSFTLRVDTITPGSSVGYTPNTWTNGNVVVNIGCSDGHSGCNMSAISGWSISGNTYTKTFTSNTSGNITVRDIAGNTKTQNYSVTNIDKSIPTTSANNSSTSLWRNTKVDITLSVSDTGGSGISYARYRWDNSGCTSGTNFTNGTKIQVPSEGTHTLYLCTGDVAGNTKTWSGVYKYDATKPTVVDNYAYDNIWTNTGRTITLTPNDPNPSGANNVSGVSSTKYCWGASCLPVTGTTGTSIVVTGQINNVLRYQSYDNAGNSSNVGVIYVKVDTTKPVTSANNSSTSLWRNTKVDITLSVSDTGGSGISYARYRWDNSGCTSGTNFTNGTKIQVPSEGTHTLYLCTGDVAGNTQTWSGVYKYDATKPTVVDNYAYDNIWTNTGRTITLTPNDPKGPDHSNLTSTKYCWGASCLPVTGTTGTSIVVTGQINNVLRYQSYDNAGNSSNVGVIYVKVDTTKPVTSANNSSTSLWRNTKVDITLSVSDTGGSGISYARYRWDNSGCTSGTNFTNGTKIQVPSEGTHTLYLCTGDVAGNTQTWSGVYKYDATKPTVVDNYAYDNIWTNTGRTITLTPNDPNPSGANNVSGVSSTKYCWGAACNPTTGTVGTSIVVTGQINDVLKYQHMIMLQMQVLFD